MNLKKDNSNEPAFSYLPVILGQQAIESTDFENFPLPPDYNDASRGFDDTNRSCEYLRQPSYANRSSNNNDPKNQSNCRKLTSRYFGFEITKRFNFLIFVLIFTTILVASASFISLTILGTNYAENESIHEIDLKSKPELKSLFGANEARFRANDEAFSQSLLLKTPPTNSTVEECVTHISYSNECKCYKVNLSQISASVAISKLKSWLLSCLYEEQYQKMFIYTGTKSELYERDVHPSVKNWLSQKQLRFEDRGDHFVVHEKITVKGHMIKVT